MTPDEIIQKLEQLNIKITRRTLLNYETWGFIEKPVRGSRGRGRGRTTEYNNIAWLYAYAAYRLIREERIPQRYVTAVINAYRSESAAGYFANYSEPDKKTAMNVEFLLFKYLVAGLSDIPYGGRIELVSQKHADEELFKSMLVCLDNNKPVRHLGTQDYDAVIIVIAKEKMPEPIANIANKDVVAVYAYMWSDNIKKWENKGFYLGDNRMLTKDGEIIMTGVGLNE